MFRNGLKSKMRRLRFEFCLSISASLLGESHKCGLNLFWPENHYVGAFCIELMLK